MRPIRRNISPQAFDFKNYEDAKNFLMSDSRLGRYCSYCERYIPTNLALEHIEPKNGKFGRPDLRGRWNNFLLACINCNSTKGTKQVDFKETLFPDRDNTFVSFTYTQNGEVSVTRTLSPQLKKIAESTLALTGLDKQMLVAKDENLRQVARDRISQRAQCWRKAREAYNFIQQDFHNDTIRTLIINNALSIGFFSIWMTVFSTDIDMRKRLIRAFPGTKDSDCFDMDTAAPISPAPNPDKLLDGGKI